jgi:PHS family inorganic phosphate transporter-like MFS transporter
MDVNDHSSWNPGLSNPSIYEALLENAERNILTVCLPSLLGSLLVIWLIDYIPRKQFLIYSFLALALLMFITGGTFRAVAYTEKFPATIVLVALCNFLFNFGMWATSGYDYYFLQPTNNMATGANTLTFIIPAELFPTSYRATCHGIAAASGKLGSVLVQVILPYMKFDANPRNEKVSKPGSTSLGYVFLVFGGVMALGALFAWVWIPSMQNPRAEGGSLVLQNKTLEELAEGVERYRSDGQVIGIRDNLKSVYKGLHRRLPQRQREPLGEEDVERK